MTDSGADRVSGSPERVPPGEVRKWHDQWAGELRAFLWGMTRNNELADDLLQATFTRALESGHTASGETVRGWLFRVAYNEVLQWRRRTGVRQRGQEAVAMRSAPASSRPPWAGMLEQEQITSVRTALASLPPDQRRVVEQRIYGEKTFAEIAADAGLPLGTVLTRMRLALEKLSRALRDRD